MSLYSQDNTPAALILALGLAVGLAGGGWLVGQGLARFHSETRTVTVKGLVEREVKSDQAVWTLDLRRASDTLARRPRAHRRRPRRGGGLPEQAGLRGGGDRAPAHAHDRQAGPRVRPGPGASASATWSRLAVVSDHPERGPRPHRRGRDGGTAQGRRDPRRRDASGAANPRYVVTKFNDLRPQLLADATQNARATAEQFAADSGAQVGGIRSANQGSIQIFGTDGNDESAPFCPPARRSRRSAWSAPSSSS